MKIVKSRRSGFSCGKLEAGRTLNFIRFTIGIVLLHSTMGIMSPGTFLLLSESVTKNSRYLFIVAIFATVATKATVFRV